MRFSFLTAMRMATAMNPTITNQNAHAVDTSSTVGRMKMKTKSRSLVVAMTNMPFIIASPELLLLSLLDLVLLGLPFRG